MSKLLFSCGRPKIGGSLFLSSVCFLIEKPRCADARRGEDTKVSPSETVGAYLELCNLTKVTPL